MQHNQQLQPTGLSPVKTAAPWFRAVPSSGGPGSNPPGGRKQYNRRGGRHAVERRIQEIKETYPGSEILFDVTSPIGVKIANKKVIESAGLDERSHLTWGLRNKKDILKWDARISIVGTHYYFRTRGIGIKNVLMGMLSDLLGMQYMIHLRLGSVIERGPTAS